MTDRRKRRWVAHDVHFFENPLGLAIRERFGPVGMVIWFGFIAACKKNHIQGRVAFGSDYEALAIFGLPGMELVDEDGQPFTLKEFFRLTGDHKVTRRTSRGRVTHVVCRRWTEWQDPRNTRTTDSQTRRSEDVFTTKKETESNRDIPSDLDLDLDPDSDQEKTLADAAATAKKTPRRDPIFETIAEVCGWDWHRLTKNERGKLNNATKQLRDIDATPDEIRAKAAAYRKTWPEMSLTPMALVNQYAQVDASTRGVSLARCSDCDQPLGDSHDDNKCAFVVGLLTQEVR